MTDVDGSGSRDVRFCAAVAGLYPEDRGRLATLRRAPGKSLATAADARWIYRTFSEFGYVDRDDNVLFLVATLIATHRPTLERKWLTGGGNLGRTMWRLQADGGLSESSATMRFRKLLDAQMDFDGSNELGHQLHMIARLASGNAVAIDWPQLLRDLRAWDAPDRRVQKAWAKAFFTVPAPGRVEEQSTSAKGERTESDAA